MVEISVSVKDNAGDVLFLGQTGNFATHSGGAVDVAVQARLRAGQGQSGSAHHGHAGDVIDNLGVDVPVAAEDNQAGTFGSAVDLAADANLAAESSFILTDSHFFHLYFLPPDLPTLRRITSVVYLMPLPL